MGFDLIIFTLMVVKLRKHARNGGISALLLNDGILYFVASILGNGTAAFFAALQLNYAMNVMGVSFPQVICTMAATRLFCHPFVDQDSLPSVNVISSRSPIAFRSSQRTTGPSADSEIYVLDELESRRAYGAGSVGPMAHHESAREQDVDVEHKKVPL